jgi:beta-1,4-mannosyltransferase
VQGEIAQSPRMMNHVRMLLETGCAVDLVGFASIALPPDLVPGTALKLHVVSRIGTRRWPRLPALAYAGAAALRAAWIALRLAIVLAPAVARNGLCLVQNPPALPALAIARIVTRLRSARLVVDWHNTTFSVLRARLDPCHPLVALVRSCEGSLARASDAHLFVSSALRREVAARWNVTGDVVRDAPWCTSARLGSAARRAILQRAGAAADDATVVAISPSSWSIDEDMQMLLDAAVAFAARSTTTRLLLFATGAGPGLPAFERRANALQSDRLCIVTGWFPEPLYRELLASADVGICMHRSTSGVDLPMKLVDMLGAGVPPLVYGDLPVLRELLTPEQCAGTFSDAAELVDRLTSVTADAPALARLETVRAAIGTPAVTWREEWRRNALPVLM